MDSSGWGVKHFNELESHGVASSDSLVSRGGVDQALITHLPQGVRAVPKVPIDTMPSSGNSILR